MIIQLLGSKGMLGQAVAREVVRRGYQLVLDDVDITAIEPSHIRAETVINTAGLVKQRTVADSYFIHVNGYAPQRIAEACDSRGARLIHVSTDCVFEHPGPHDEHDCPSGGDIYAVSKRAGEVTRSPHLTVRTSFIGWGPRGLLHELMTKPSVHASSRLLWSGHTAATVAECLVNVAESTAIQGLLHIPGTFQSRLDLVQSLINWLDVGVEVIQDDSFEQDRRLVSRRWIALGLPPPPPFVVQLERMSRLEKAA